MDVSEAAKWFNSVPVAGWNGASWVFNVGYGDFHSFDRFVTERTFGVKKRVFHTPEDTKIDFATYPVVRTPDYKTWIITNESPDILGLEVYANTYFFLDAPIQAQVIEFTTETLASGAEGATGENVVGTYYCDLERYSGRSSNELENVVYGVYDITFPSNVPVTVEHEIKLGSTYYEIKEISTELLTKVCRCWQRA